MRKGDRVKIHLPATAKRGASQFHLRTGTLSYRSDVGKRWFVHLDGDKEGDCVEFLPSEMVMLDKGRHGRNPHAKVNR